MALQTQETLFFIDRDMEQVDTEPIAMGMAAVFAARCPGREGPNEDAVGLVSLVPDRGVLILADGFGGHPAGNQAAEIAVREIERAVRTNETATDDLRALIMEGFDRANAEVLALGVGAATTLAVLEIVQNRVRSYHVGDSGILVVGQRGKVKLRTMAHSPVGYAVESGLVEEDEAMYHEERHLVSNMVGSPDMRIDVGPVVHLALHDTVLMGSDGLFDNLTFDDIVARIRKGPLAAGVAELVRTSREIMTAPQPDQPSKLDDLSIVAFRRARGQ